LVSTRVFLAWALAALVLTGAGVYRGWHQRVADDALRKALHEQEDALHQSIAGDAFAAAQIASGTPSTGSAGGRSLVQPPTVYKKKLDSVPDVAKVAWAIPAVMQLDTPTRSQLRVVFERAAFAGLESRMQASGATSQTMELPHRIRVTLQAPSFDVQPAEPQEKEVSSEGTWDWMLTPKLTPGTHLVFVILTAAQDDSRVAPMAPLERNVTVIERHRTFGEELAAFVSRHWMTLSGASNLLAALLIAVWLKRPSR